jgi:hypothetical protein
MTRLCMVSGVDVRATQLYPSLRAGIRQAIVQPPVAPKNARVGLSIVFQDCVVVVEKC